MPDFRAPRTYALLMVAAVLFFASLISLGSRVAIPLHAIELAASPLTIGAILSSYALIPVFFAITFGRWIDRIGSRLPMRIAAASLTVGQLLPWMFPSLWALAVSAVTVGSGMALVMISVHQTAGTLGDASSRTRIFTMMTLVQSLTMMVSPPLTGLLIDSLGHRAAFLALGLAGALMLATLLAAGHLLPAEPKGSAPVKRRLMELMQLPAVRAALIISSLSPIGWELFFFFVPLHGASIGLSASTIGVVFTSFSLSVFGIRVAVPWLARRASEWTLIAIAMGTAGVMFLLFPLARDAATLMMLSIVLGAGMGISQPITLSLVYAVSPDGRQAEVLGTRTTAINAAQIVSPLLLGALSASIGLTMAAWPFALLLLAGSRFAYSRTAALGVQKAKPT